VSESVVNDDVDGKNDVNASATQCPLDEEKNEAENILKIKVRENEFLKNEAENVLKTHLLTINHIKAENRLTLSDTEDRKLLLESSRKGCRMVPHGDHAPRNTGRMPLPLLVAWPSWP
jgi:hypothetical protein